MTTRKRTSPAREVDAVADHLQAATILLSRRLRVEDEARGLSPPRLSALSVLSTTGPMRLGELALAEAVEPPTMTRLIDALERDGLVARGRDPHDARAVQVRVTASGTRALADGRARRGRALAGGLRALSPVELRTVERSLTLLERAIGEKSGA